MSADTTATMASRIAEARAASASNKRPKASESAVTARPNEKQRSHSIAGELAQLGADLRRALDHRGPCRLVRHAKEPLGFGGTKIQRRNAGLLLAVDLGLDHGDILVVERLEPRGGIFENLALRVGQSLPGIQIDQHPDLDALERRLQPILRHLVPAEIEDTEDWPTIAVDDAAFERGVDFAGRSGDSRAAQRLNHILVDRGHPDFQAGEVKFVDLLVEVDVERNIVELPREIPCVELLIVELIDIGPGTFLALLLHRFAEQLLGIRLRHEIREERAGDVRDINHMSAYGVADLEWRHGSRTTDIVDLDYALAVCIHFLDKALEVLGELRAFGERGDRPQGDFLGRDWRGRECQQQGAQD